MNIGKKFHDIRESKGLTKYRLTQITGISGHHIKGIEDGSRQPTIETLQRLLEAMGCTMAEFFNDNTQSAYLTQSERTLVENYRKMDKDKADALLTVSKALI
ncbi:MAG: helix-turn-helix transcriptional regulator [Ruminococcus sp.]|nr:helix-turn-helix transcriptional regulator [Ruminococcus sp.]